MTCESFALTLAKALKSKTDSNYKGKIYVIAPNGLATWNPITKNTTIDVDKQYQNIYKNYNYNGYYIQKQ